MRYFMRLYDQNYYLTYAYLDKLTDFLVPNSL